MLEAIGGSEQPVKPLNRRLNFHARLFLAIAQLVSEYVTPAGLIRVHDGTEERCQQAN